MKSFIIFVGIFLTLTVFSESFKEVTVKGQAAILNNDKLAAKEKALDDAKRNAVEQVAGVIVSSESLTENFELISDNIYSQSKGYISSYKIVKEGISPEDKDVYFVEIKAKVSNKKLEKDISAINLLYKSLGKPKFLLMIAEQNFDEKTPSGWWNNAKATTNSVETVIIDELSKKGIKFVDGRTLKDKLAKYSAFKNIDSVTTKDILSISKLHDGDYIIYGSVIATVKDGLSGTKSGFAIGTLKLVKSDTGEVVGTIELKDRNNKDHNPEHYRGEATNRPNSIIAAEDAFSAFGKRASKQILKKILKHWLKQANSTREISLKIKGLTYSDYKKLKSHLLELRGVKSVGEFGMVNKIASLPVNYKGKATELLDLIMSKPVKGLRFELQTVTKNEIVLEVKK